MPNRAASTLGRSTLVTGDDRNVAADRAPGSNRVNGIVVALKEIDMKQHAVHHDILLETNPNASSASESCSTVIPCAPDADVEAVTERWVSPVRESFIQPVERTADPSETPTVRPPGDRPNVSGTIHELLRRFAGGDHLGALAAAEVLL